MRKVVKWKDRIADVVLSIAIFFNTFSFIKGKSRYNKSHGTSSHKRLD